MPKPAVPALAAALVRAPAAATITARARRLAALALLSVAADATATPIVIRHDRSDAEALRRGRRYAGVVAEVTIPSRQDSARRVTVANGTLIAPTWVLTAAHVAAPTRTRIDSAHLDGRVPMVRIAGREYRIAEAIPVPEFRGPGSPDVGLLRLAAPVRDAIPARLYTGRDEVGQLVVLAGTGGGGTGLSGPRPADGQLRAATNRIDGADGSFISFRFDHPDSSGATELEGVSGPGDSGGPAFLERDGRLYVAGVSSVQDSRGRPEGTYGVREHYARVSEFAGWIERTMQGHRGPWEPLRPAGAVAQGAGEAAPAGGMRPEIRALVEGLLAAIAAGDEASIRAFADRHLAPTFGDGEPAASPDRQLRRLHETLGRPALIGAQRAENRLRLRVRSGRGGGEHVLELTLDGGTPPRIAGVRESLK